MNDSQNKQGEQSSTPKTNAVAKMIGRLAYQLKAGELTLPDFADVAQVELHKLGAIERELSLLSQQYAPPKEVEERIDELAAFFIDQYLPENFEAHSALCELLKSYRDELATELTKGRDAGLAEITRIVHDEMHECGCTGGSFIYGCRHSVRRLRQLLADLGHK